MAIIDDFGAIAKLMKGDHKPAAEDREPLMLCSICKGTGKYIPGNVKGFPIVADCPMCSNAPQAQKSVTCSLCSGTGSEPTVGGLCPRCTGSGYEPNIVRRMGIPNATWRTLTGKPIPPPMVTSCPGCGGNGNIRGGKIPCKVCGGKGHIPVFECSRCDDTGWEPSYANAAGQQHRECQSCANPYGKPSP